MLDFVKWIKYAGEENKSRLFCICECVKGKTYLKHENIKKNKHQCKGSYNV